MKTIHRVSPSHLAALRRPRALRVQDVQRARKALSLSLGLGMLAVVGSTASAGAFAADDAKAPAPLHTAAARKSATVFQLSTLPALGLGLFDGTMTFADLLTHGDFGIGTFDHLDGELIILDGKAWRARADGTVTAVENKETTPFADITFFQPSQTIRVAASPDPSGAVEYTALQSRISAALPTPNAPYALAIHGTFARIRVRSVPGQRKPFPTLATVVKTQTEWEWTNIRGTLVGFRFPGYLSGVNLADYHFHFLSDDKRHGGHLLTGALQEGEIRIQTLRGLEMRLPSDAGFDRADLSADQSAALKAAEKGGAK